MNLGALTNDSTSKRVLNELETINLRFWKITIQRITVVKFGVNNRGGDSTGCFEIKVGTNTAEFANVRITGFRQ